ncbi:hypothetical protein VB780_17705 [Leptolyngbya sp. CCNP1308]|uniref:hypothetical protein n=1 Tax=Leptolyngbya sp. CCNP1308 TaxID=3110255 RepID=UPI002B202E36|nr:hypothetical protein [Leptolyngbya sp. CCNP1308]MEA5450421.1 hypothetical protein [Leptolyngbya sp. CCNP1308]
MPANLAQSLLQRRRPTLVWAMAIAAGVAIAGCRPSPPPQSETLNPTPPPPADSAPETPAAQPTESPTPTPAAPSNTPTATLPNALIREWQPLSNVLLAFGSMTLTPDQVQWSSGQVSPYTLISTEGGYLLELEASPSFYDTQNRYIKLIPKADATAESIEVAFYPDDTQLQNDEYIMYGGYFAE